MSPTALRTRLLTAVAAVAVTAPIASTAFAAGFALKEQSVSGMGAAYAGVTAGANGDASSMFYNPATMGLVTGIEVVQTATGVIVKSKVDSASATRAARLGGTAIRGDASPGDIAQDALIPSGYFVYSVNNDLKLGLSANGPWGLVTDYGDAWIGRYHGIRSDLRTYNFAPTVSYRINPMITVGGGVQIQYAKAKLSQASDFGASRLGRPGALDVKSDVTGDDWGWGFTLGALIEPVKGTRIGLAYRSPVNHTLTGNISFTGLPAALAGALPGQGAKADLTTPDVASIGLYHEVNDRWAVMADVQWTNWSRFRELRVNIANPALSSLTEEHWNDTWYYSLGTSYKVTDKLTLRGGVAFDKGSVDIDYRTPRVPEQNRYWLSVGAGYQVTDSIRVDAAYSHVFVPGTSVALTDDLTGAEAGRGNLNVKYKSSIDLVGLQAKFTF
ncbi:OmpP1/FadL family transporter [Azospirillum picis]|uniref:Long-chain fatty acid transport protein n=1 Tax=Azospirillum picis TaxID=488438 RepID=A0ABU0MEP3_9PROT|nr:outer membrane protein transport protein [Azospirillum picis]MBP2298072.1 long-chain fatty acid transport protein [Azospirillum picis]MDQ0531910.1 long-chain fatty acid transport protein [Azospirillum picis]